MKQQLVGRHVAPLRYIILIQSQPVFAYWYSLMLRALSGEAANANFIVRD